ncbi:MAG: DMT family transporter [Burkholderiales bacterium]
MNTVSPAHVLVFATSLAMVGITTGLALQGGSTPLTIVTVRTIAVLVLFAVYFRLAGVNLSMTPRERAIALAIGVILCLNNWTLNEALGSIPLPLAILIFYLWPAITSVATWLLGTERFTWRSLAGIVLAFAGVALALNVEFTEAQSRGVLLAVLSAVAWSCVFVLAGHFFKGRDSRPVTFWMTVTAAVIFVVVTVITRDWTLPATTGGWVGIATIPFFYAFGMIGLFVATTSLGPMRTGFFMNFEPIATVLLAVPILGQQLQPIQMAGAVLVIVALFLFRPLKP